MSGDLEEITSDKNGYSNLKNKSRFLKDSLFMKIP
jgi:hypothetical protein